MSAKDLLTAVRGSFRAGRPVLAVATVHGLGQTARRLRLRSPVVVRTADRLASLRIASIPAGRQTKWGTRRCCRAQTPVCHPCGQDLVVGIAPAGLECHATLRPFSHVSSTRGRLRRRAGHVSRRTTPTRSGPVLTPVTTAPGRIGTVGMTPVRQSLTAEEERRARA